MMKLKPLVVLFVGILVLYWSLPDNSSVVRIVTAASTGNGVSLSVHADRTEVNPGDTVKLTVTLETNAPLNKPSKLLLYVNGDVMKEISLSPLDAGTVINYEFDFTPDTPGYYVIQVTLVKQAGVL